MSEETNRGQMCIRMFKLAVMLSSRGYPIGELAKTFEVSTKTIRRNIRVLEEVGVPVWQEDGFLWRVDRHFLKRFM